MSLVAWTAGCAGIGGFAVGDRQTATTPNSEFVSEDWPSGWSTRSKLLSEKGPPKSTQSSPNGCEVLEYDAGPSWSGLGIYLIVVPIPLMLPSGRQSDRFYVAEEEIVGRTIEFLDVNSGLGVLCGSSECGGVLGPILREPLDNSLDEILDRCG